MKTLVLLPLVVLLPACTNVTMLGHESAYDVNAEYQAEPITPVSMNAGFESESFAVVPPKKPVSFLSLISTNTEGAVHDSDVSPTISRLKIQRVANAAAPNGISLDYVTSGATGNAAILAAGGTPINPASTVKKQEDNKKATSLATSIDEITNDVNSIPALKAPRR